MNKPTTNVRVSRYMCPVKEQASEFINVSSRPKPLALFSERPTQVIAINMPNQNAACSRYGKNKK